MNNRDFKDISIFLFLVFVMFSFSFSVISKENIPDKDVRRDLDIYGVEGTVPIDENIDANDNKNNSAEQLALKILTSDNSIGKRIHQDIERRFKKLNIQLDSIDPIEKMIRITVDPRCYNSIMPLENKVLEFQTKRQIVEAAYFAQIFYESLLGKNISLLTFDEINVCSTLTNKDIYLQNRVLHIKANKMQIMSTKEILKKWNDGVILTDKGIIGEFLTARKMKWEMINPIGNVRYNIRVAASKYKDDISKVLEKIIKKYSGDEQRSTQDKIDQDIKAVFMQNVRESALLVNKSEILQMRDEDKITLLKNWANNAKDDALADNLFMAYNIAHIKAEKNRNQKKNVVQFGLIAVENFHDIGVDIDLYKRYQTVVKVDDNYERWVVQIAPIAVSTDDRISVNINSPISFKDYSTAALNDALRLMIDINDQDQDQDNIDNET